MLSLLRNTALVSTALALGACASIVSGSDQEIEIVTYGVDTASCEVVDRRGITYQIPSTPGIVRVGRNEGPLEVACRKEGYQTAETTVYETLNPWVFGNILIGGFIGLAIDLFGDSYQSYDGDVALTLEPAEGATQTSALAPAAPPPLTTGSTLSSAEASTPPPAPALLPGPSASAPPPIGGNLSRAEMMLQEAQATLNTPPPPPPPPGPALRTQPAATQPAAVPATLSQPITASGRYAVQVGAFGNRNNATRLVQRIENAGMPTFTRPQRNLTAVRLGPYGSRSEASAAARSYRQTFGGQAVIVRN